MEIDQALVDFVREAKVYGLSNEEIVGELVQSGWPAPYLQVLNTDSDLLNYIGEARAQGVSEESIAQELVGQGWPTDYLRLAFMLHPPLFVATPKPQPNPQSQRQHPPEQPQRPSVQTLPVQRKPSNYTYGLSVVSLALLLPAAVTTVLFLRAMVLSWLGTPTASELLDLIVLPMVLSGIFVPVGLFASATASHRLVALATKDLGKTIYVTFAVYQTLTVLIASGWLVFLIGRFVG